MSQLFHETRQNKTKANKIALTKYCLITIINTIYINNLKCGLGLGLFSVYLHDLNFFYLNFFPSVRLKNGRVDGKISHEVVVVSIVSFL